jgi:thiamine monophosphate synthase
MSAIQTAIQAIHQLSNDELDKAFEAIKLRRNYLTRQKATMFRVNDRVSFAARGMQVLGTVVKVNPKTIHVRQDNSFTTWRVHASLLKPVRAMTAE